MEGLMVILLILTVAVLVQLAALRKNTQTLSGDIATLQERLNSLRREIRSPGLVSPPAVPVPPVPAPSETSTPSPEATPPVAPVFAAAASEPVSAPVSIPEPTPEPEVKPAGRLRVIDTIGAKPGVSAATMPPPPLPSPSSMPHAMESEPAAGSALPAPELPLAVAASAAEEGHSPRRQAALEILGKIWKWFLVGEEFRPAGVAMEYAVATTWLMRAGIVAVVMCIGYFLKWSIERELIGPTGRVGISVLVGVALLVWGLCLLGKRWHLLGQGFMGGGLAVLYFSLYAAGPLYHLLSIESVFGLMALVTLAAGIIAVMTSSLLVAILGIIGGFVTPLMLSTGQANFPALFAYMLLLNLGILGIAHFRQWRLLNYLSFVGTYVLFAASMDRYYQHERDFKVAIIFLSLFFLIQSLLVYLYNIRRAIRSSILEILHMVLNTGLYSLAAYTLIEDAHGRPYPAIMTAALAVYFILHVIVFLQRQLADRPLLLGLLALAGFYAVLTLPLVLEKETLTICWALQAFLFLWLGSRLDSRFIRNLGYAMYLLVFGRLMLFDFQRDFRYFHAAAVPMAEYWRQMGERLWTFGTAIGSLFAAFALEHWQVRRREAGPGPITPANDMPEVVPPSVAGTFFFWSVVVMLFLFLQLEFHAMLGYYTALRPAVLTFLWCGLALFFLWRHLMRNDTTMWVALCLCAAVVVLKSLLDMQVWDLREDGWFHAEYALDHVVPRWLDFLSVLGLFFVASLILLRRSATENRVAGRVFGYGGLFLLFLYLSLETNSCLHWKLAEFQGGGVSVLWTLFALGFVAGGIWKRVRPLRYVGLLLFAIVVAKVFLLDLAHMVMIYRVLAFLVVGVLLLLGAFAYLYAARQFREEERGA